MLIRPMRESHLDEADKVFRLAFGTFIGLPDPTQFAAGVDYIHGRFHANPEGAIVAEEDGRLIGANMAANWGSFGTFGPLLVRPEYWNKGVAQTLLGPTMEIFAQWKVRDAGLFTFSNSPKHITLYQKFGFWPRFLIGIMAKTVVPCRASFTTAGDSSGITDAIYEGLDAAVEIRSVEKQNLGATIFTEDAFAVCHCGEGTEAGPGKLYIKFAAVKPGPGISSRFTGLLEACESYAASRGLTRIEAGVHMERTNCYRDMLQLGFRLERASLAMHRDNNPAYNRPETYVLDDWR
jgi:GNAT superfamily N-acetyltransferase